MKKKGSFFERLKSNRQTQIISILILVGIVCIVAFIVYSIMGKKGDDDNGEIIGETISSPYRKLDGVEASVSQENEYPVAVMIENLKSVRPQAGLSKAGVVYEVLAEGGITRFMAIFASEEVPEIGPVRSARTYFLSFVLEYDALYAHAGGSPAALQKIKNDGIKSINQIGGDQEYYWRDKSLRAPHNLFTKTELLSFALRDDKLEDEKPDYQGWKFEDEAALKNRSQEEKTINLPFSSESYDVNYQYDLGSNSYLRNNGGFSQVDKNTDEQLKVKNVIVQYVDQRIIDNEGRLEIDVLGQGKAVLFKNGNATLGTWEKGSDEGRTLYYDEQGNEHIFIRGNTWVELFPSEKEIVFN